MRVIVRLLGEVAALPGGLMLKKCHLLDGLCDLAAADEWRWALFSSDKREMSATCLGVLRRKLHIAFAPPHSWLEVQSAPVDTDHAPPSLPSAHVIFSRRSLDDGIESRIALCRERSSPAYSSRESHLASLVLDENPWLHWRDWKPRSAVASKPLSPRQQLTLDLLLIGLGRKEIAAHIGISSGTVVGYIREVYRHFGVNSQAELMRGHLSHSIPKKHERRP